jgi:hypothetical protein
MEAGLRIRVDEQLRRDFLATCHTRDTTASQVLRAYMRSFVAEHGRDLMQQDLFANVAPVTTAQNRALG